MNVQAHINMADLVEVLDELISIISDSKGIEQAVELEGRFYDALQSLLSQVVTLQLEEPGVLH